MVTTSGVGEGAGVPVPSYRVETPAPLSDTHSGSPADVEMPQGLRRLGSVCAAMPAMLDTRFVWRKPLSRWWLSSAAAVTAGAAPPTINSPAVIAASRIEDLLVGVMTVLPFGG